MDKDNLKATLKKLHANLDATGKVDAELKGLLQTLSGDIQHLLNQEPHVASNAVELTEQTQALSAKFAAQHPHLEPFFRELIDALARMGI